MMIHQVCQPPTLPPYGPELDTQPKKLKISINTPMPSTTQSSVPTLDKSIELVPDRCGWPGGG